jgi:hypothetical protein
MGASGKDLNVHFDALANALEPWRNQIVGWANEFDVVFGALVDDDRAFIGGGMTIEARTLARIASFGAAFDFQVFCCADCTSNEDQPWPSGDNETAGRG